MAYAPTASTATRPLSPRSCSAKRFSRSKPLELGVVGPMMADRALIAQHRHEIGARVRVARSRATSSGVPVAIDGAAAIAAFGTEIDQIVRGLDDVEIVLDHEHAYCPASPGAASTSSSLWMSAKCKPGRRLVEHVERAAGRAARELGRELDALRFAAGERRRRLTHLDVAEADVADRSQLVVHARNVGEELVRFVDAHLEHVGDRLALDT